MERHWLTMTQDNGEVISINLNNVACIVDVYSLHEGRVHARVVMTNHDQINFVNQKAADLLGKMGIVVPAEARS